VYSFCSVWWIVSHVIKQCIWKYNVWNAINTGHWFFHSHVSFYSLTFITIRIVLCFCVFIFCCSFCFCVAFCIINDDDDNDDGRMTGAMMLKFVMLRILNTVGIWHVFIFIRYQPQLCNNIMMVHYFMYAYCKPVI